MSDNTERKNPEPQDEPISDEALESVAGGVSLGGSIGTPIMKPTVITLPTFPEPDLPIGTDPIVYML